MKFLIVFMFFSFPVFACSNYIPHSEAVKAIALSPDAGKLSCKDLPQEACYCFDGIDWESATIIDEVVNGAPIYTVNSQSLCTDEDACKLAMSTLQCDIGFTAKYRMDNPQAFCERLDGYEQVNTGQKVLVNDDAKKVAKEQRQAIKEQKRLERKAKRDAAKEELKNIDWAQITTIAKMRQVLRSVVDKIDDLEE